MPRRLIASASLFYRLQPEVKWAMEAGLFGRTNRPVPHLWIKPLEPAEPDTAEAIALALGDIYTVVDITFQPTLYGRFLPASTELLATLPVQFQFADSEQKAFDLATAGLIQILSAVGRSKVDFLAIEVESPLEDFQIDGALKAAQSFLEEDNASHIGLSFHSSGHAAMTVWQLHDAFSFCILPSRVAITHRSEFEALASSRRVGLAINYCRQIEEGGMETVLSPRQSKQAPCPDEVAIIPAKRAADILAICNWLERYSGQDNGGSVQLQIATSEIQ